MSETPDQARTRRRWITLAEFVAVAGLVIGALTLWSNWSDRRADEAEKATEQSSAARERARLDLSATVAGSGRSLELKDERHDIADMTVTFPKALGVAPQHPAGDPVIDAGWFDRALLRLTDGGADEQTGRLPVLLTVHYWDGDAARTGSGIYDVVWKTEGHLLRGRSLSLEGLKLRQRGGTPAALEAAWRRAKPTPPGR